VLAYLEDSGYLARAAFIMDKLMYSIGLHGKSFIPMLMGFGCSTPAIMATRTIEDRNDRLITILVTPFMSCGARLPVYVMLAGAFFSARAGSIIWGLYVLGIIVAIVSAKLLRTFVLPGRPAPFIMELPSYRRPTLRTGLLHMWQKGSIYLRRAGTFILMGAMVVWLMAAFPAGVEYGSEASYAGQFGKLLEPLVKPLGFDWKIAVALFFGFLAKEVVIGSMGVLYGAGENEVLLSSALQSDPAFSPLVALCLMVFTLIYMPCVAALGMTKKETGSWGWTAFAATFSTGLAWIMTFLVYRLGLAIGI
ncbi:MAG: ferrous iron transport protein B, partial [Methanopyri archaeon]|nr:ferrous iron transport protein B [Methanopyri archaeon]